MSAAFRLLAGLAALSLLGACASGSTLELPADPPARLVSEGCGTDVPAALAYFRRLRQTPRLELTRELDRLRAAYAADSSPGQRLQLALLLALPGGPAEDERRAIALLREQREGSADACTRDLCQMLEVLLAAAWEHESRLRTALEDQKEKRQRIAALEQDLKQSVTRGREQEARVLLLHRALAREQAAAADHKRQLEELRKIESSLESRRGAPVPVRSPDEPEQGQNPAGR